MRARCWRRILSEGQKQEDRTIRFSYGLMAGLAIAATLPAAAQPSATAPGQRICLNNQDVQSATSNDGKTMVFRMRNGTTYINHMRGSCPGLRFNGFVWELRGINDICENQQTLRVLKSGEVCMLGKFDPPQAPGVKPPRPQ